jgi:hypothetical protein
MSASDRARNESENPMDGRIGLQSTLRIEDVPTVRSMVAQKLREAIMSGTFEPGHAWLNASFAR